MKRVVVTLDSGEVLIYEDVIDYGIIDKDEVEEVCKTVGVEYSQKIVDEVKRWCGHADHLPTYDDLIDCVSQFKE